MGTCVKFQITALFLLVSLVARTSQNTRNKRQIQPELPRILTQNGHLVFQTGTNHNISFTSTNGGFINVNGENLAVISQTVKDNKLAIDRIQTSPTASSGLASRINTIENRLNNLQPTGQVQTQLLTLGHRIDFLQTTLPDNVNTRLTQVENSLNDLQATGQVQELIQGLTTRLTRVERRISYVHHDDDGEDYTLEDRVRRSASSRTVRRSIRRVSRRVTQLQNTVENLQNLLTVDECDSNPCQNGGTCVDTYNGYICQCPASFQGQNCATDVNECAIYAGTDLGCQNGATCTNTIGSFTCQCATNWHGIRCTESHDDCTGASSSELCGHGTCVNVPRTQQGQAKYTCICDDGWTTTGGSDPACTVDVNECTTAGRPVCSVDPPVTCINLPGTFTCGSCPAGYSGNGFTCVDINECAMNNGGCSMAPMVQCINTPGSRQCGPCPDGFQGTGVTCTWVGMCQDNNGGCYPTAACTESQGFQGRTCTCPPGYVGNGIGASGCVAQGPVTGACGSTPCMNGAACQNLGTNGYRCVCLAGYSGQNCETNINECSSNPCQNGGSCSDRVNGYMCQCPDSHTGANCEVVTSQCGASLTGESGTFRYPTVSGTQYPHDVSCAWRITTTRGKILIVTFPSFNIEYHENCNYDHLQVNDGPTAASHPIGRYCGDTPPNNGQPINSTDNQIYFWFKSDVNVASDGFSVQWRSAPPVCGGQLEGSDHGEFTSPGYPGNYPHDRDCVWTITVSPGKKIMLNFATLALEHHPDCNYDYIEIRDGTLDTSPVLRRFCNTTIPPPLTTTGPEARVLFHSDSNQNDQGFHITYAALDADTGCGGTFTSETGILISPNYPNPYQHDASCVWIIRVHDQDQVTLTFTNNQLEGHETCQYDYVEVRDGDHGNSPLIGRYCGSNIPVPLTTTGNVMYVKFVSDSSHAGTGFRATWRVGCGGHFTAPTGTLRSPYYPDSYPSNRQCEYFITQPVGYRITLTFNAFDIEANGCNFDYLEIRDGGSSNSPQLGSYCGAQIPDPLTTTGNEMYLKFVTDGSIQNLGFEATYTTEEAGCGGQLTTETGLISSPGHPNVYPHGINCTWYIRVEPGMVVRLTFHTFSMEHHTNCVHDSVTLYDNSTAVASSQIGKYCGGTMPPVTTSTNNYLTVVMETDSSVSFEGFTASYVTLNASTLCGSHLTDPTGVITSPGYPENYPHQRECTWTIVAEEGHQILLNITDFDLEQHSNCNFDYLEIRNGGFPSSPLAGKYCGTTFDRIIVSHSNRMFIKFVTDSSQSHPGFRLYYEATATGCGADLTSTSGSFISPNYPMPYGHNAECFWTITTARGSTVQLTFVDFDLEYHYRCYYDFIEVRSDGPNGNLLGKFCGSSIPDPVISRGHVMWIKYRTDMSVPGRGFHAFYNSICENTLTDFSGVIESPNFPNDYPHNRNCTWIIQVAMGNTVNITFSHFELEYHRNCQFDNLQIRDGGDQNANQIGIYCGSDLPSPLASTGDQVWIRFLSDYSLSHNGFRLEYITDGCGGYLNTPTGTFTSPDYPNPYPHRRQCDWKIAVATGQAIQLTIENFDLESHSSCRYDVLEVYAGPDDSGPKLSQLCHTQTSPQIITSTGNEMFVRLKSDSSRHGNGFSASYKSISGGCGGNFTAKSGSIISKNYPNNYPHNTECEWLITVQELHSIVLTFADFDLEGSSNCQFDYVAVYDGPDSSYPEMVKHCGNSMPSPPIYRSQSNTMYIRMRTDSSAHGKGFKADYVTGCGGTINAEMDGVLTSPNYPESYPRRSNCSWLLQADHATDRITLTFTHLDLEEHGECDHDSVTVYDGNDEYAPQRGKYCGSTVPSAVTSQGSAMYVQFMSDYSQQGSGFRATYTKSTSACGADFTSAAGSFTSPGFPNSYPTSTECVWTISVSPGNKVQLSFSMFNIEYHEFCNFDYVEIHEGQLGGPLLGRFCGTDMPSNLTAYSGLWIKFRSDESNTGQGFIAQYAAVYGGDITGTSGQIASPAYPNQYPHNTEAAWTITVPTDMRIQISFETLDMERSYNENCLWDYLAFQDGGTAESPELQRVCGTDLPNSFVSTTNQLYIIFHSDWSSTGQGFLLNWQATSDFPMATVSPSEAPSGSQVPGCGGTLNVTEDIQTLVSPGYPYGYQDNLECTWYLHTEHGTRVWMNITDIDIESHGSCNYDFIKFTDGTNPTGYQRRLGTYCGRTGNTQPILSYTNGASIMFKTDVSRNETGFAIQYKSACGARLRNVNSGILKSPGYPNNYPANSNCVWTISVLRGRTVTLTFDSFNIEGTQGSCTGDYLQLLNGRTATSPPLGLSENGKYCGSSAPVSMETSSQYLYVAFVSDNTGSAPGFSLSYSEKRVACGGQLTVDIAQPSGTFTSPNYPQNYQHNLDCVWVITGPSHVRLQLDFIEDFEVERHSRCVWDFINVRDGGTVNSPSLAKVCGLTRPPSVYTTGNVMYVRFRTDSSAAKKGFKARYRIASCGGHYTPIPSSPITISSPNYPSNYDNNADCEWTFEGLRGHFLTFTFEAFQLQSTENCSGDFVEIREINSTGPVLVNACGFQVPLPVSTSDQYGHVMFKSDGSTQLSGFSLTVSVSVEECGGDLNTPSGSFVSPNFPNNYPHSRLCEWKITVPEGRRVSINFDPFNIQGHRYCRYDRVMVYNGIYPDSPRFKRLCGDTTPSVIKVSGNMARVTFRTDGSVSNGGFRATYNSLDNAECGGNILTSPGNISSPGYEFGNYSNNLECIWTLNNQQFVNSSIVIQFRDLQLEEHTRCRYDWLELREGDSIDGLILDKFCGNNTLPGPIITPVPSVWIRFRTDQSIYRRGFLLKYNFTSCGGILTNPTGVLTSPNYPSDYDHKDACAWQINAPEGMRISLVFDDFSMENHSNCRYDYLEIFNGPYASSPSVGKFCGLNMPQPIKSQSSSVRIVFYTDFSMAARGFRLNYSFEGEGCGGTFSSREGNLSTPNFPRSYPHNTECVWDINTSPGYFVTLSFNPPFDMENAGDCQYDYVEVSDALGNGTLVSLGRWCGNVLPPVLKSSGRRIVVKFRSDANTNGNGFSANWASGCGGIISGGQQRGILTSPNFPDIYDNNLLCNYTLAMDPQHYILIHFDRFNFNLERGYNCRFDSLAFYQGNSTAGRQLGKFCGTTVPQDLSALGSMFIQFKTDSSVQRKGYRLYYRVSQCGGVYTAPRGSIYTPTYPTQYHNDHNCTWSITVDPNKVISFKFTRFSLEYHSTCDADYVDLYDGPNFNSPLIGRYCGNVVPREMIQTTTHQMLINFITDYSVTGDGFRGYYFETYGPSQGCGGYLNGTAGAFSSLDTDSDGEYENNLHCPWTIVAPVNKVIQLTITGFNLEYHRSCRYDYLKIYDGMSIEDPLIGTYCGNSTPPAFTSSSNVLYVVFHTDSSVTTAGFNATFTTQDALCGGVYISRSTPQTITSPGYPAAFRQAVNCRWTIDAPTSTDKVEVNVTALDLQSNAGCTPEYLELRDRPLDVRGRTVHSCGNTPPALFDSFGQTVQINYVATSGESTGFSLTYKTVSCNRTYIDTQGQIYSPGWPGVYPNYSNCEILIQGPINTTVSLYFNSFQIEHHSDCQFDYLKIHNGSNSNTPVIRTLCGWMIPDPVFATTNSVWMKFKTDNSVRHPGFDITYTTTTQGVGCGGNITGINGSLTSPGYPSNYTSQSACTWLITVPARRQITLTFTDMRMFDSVNCGTDYVIVYDGNSDMSSEFGRYCGGEVPSPFTSSSNTAFVKYVSDGIGSAIGFRLTFTSIL